MLTTEARRASCSVVSDSKSGMPRRNSSNVWSLDALVDMRIERKVARSSAHSVPDCVHLTVAARGVLYSSASSPNESPDAYVLTDLPGIFLR